MTFGDLANQSQAQTDATLGTRLSLGTVEGLEDPLPFRFGDSRSSIRDDESNEARIIAGFDVDLDWDFAVADRILEQIPNEPSKQSWVGFDRPACKVL
jgi:hypothetical protein